VKTKGLWYRVPFRIIPRSDYWWLTVHNQIRKSIIQHIRIKGSMKGVYQTVHVPKHFCMWPNLSCSCINSELLVSHFGRDRNKLNYVKILNGKKERIIILHNFNSSDDVDIVICEHYAICCKSYMWTLCDTCYFINQPQKK
jgi:hypothetical protein